jgi:hypothetical protein
MDANHYTLCYDAEMLDDVWCGYALTVLARLIPITPGKWTPVVWEHEGWKVLRIGTSGGLEYHVVSPDDETLTVCGSQERAVDEIKRVNPKLFPEPHFRPVTAEFWNAATSGSIPVKP